MSAKDHLSIQLFHGTNVPFKKGEIIEPMEVDSPWKEDFPETSGYAHATYDHRYAEMFADRAHDHFGSEIGPESKPRVYRVEPVDSMEPDPAGPNAGWRSSKGFRVVDIHSEGIPDENAFGGFRDFEKKK